jgi:hypothetical protein
MELLDVSAVLFHLPLQDAGVAGLDFLVIVRRHVVWVAAQTIARVDRVGLAQHPILLLEEALVGLEAEFDVLALLIAFRLVDALDKGLLRAPAKALGAFFESSH